MPEDDGLERSQQPTPKRKSDFKKKGQVPRSRDLNSFVLLFAASGMLLLSGSHILSTLRGVLTRLLSVPRDVVMSMSAMINLLADSIYHVLLSLLPLFVCVFIVALLAPALIGGWNFSAKSISFKIEKLNPLKGIKRMVSIRSLTELLKALAKFILILTFGSVMLWLQTDRILSFANMPVEAAIISGIQLLGFTFLFLTFSLLIISAVDVPFQLWDHNRKLKMTHKEIKDEQKQTEGSPEVKRRIRETQQAMSRQRMLLQVPFSDVVVVNPTHYAVALKYDEGQDAAPRVVAKGKDYLAQQIRELATQHKVTIYSAPPLAKVLAYVFQLSKHQRSGGPRPKAVTNLKIPADFTQIETEETTK